jgi:hypothetical protein
MDSHEHAAAHARPGRGALRPALLGVALALPFIPLLTSLTGIALDLLAMLLAATAGVYVGFALNDGRRTVFWMELLLAFGTFACAAMGLWGPSWWLALGYLGHGAWDVLHHAGTVKTAVRPSYPPFCAAFDWAVAVLILVIR